MELLFSIGLHNAAIAAILAILVWSVTRIWKSAPAAHLLWLLVLAKLLTPPVVYFSSGPWKEFTTRSANLTAAPATVEIQPNARTVSDVTSQPVKIIPSIPAPIHPEEALQSPPMEFVHPRPMEPSQPALPVLSWETIRLAVVWTWLVVAAIIASIVGVRIVRMRRILSSLQPAAPWLQMATDELSNRMGLRTSADILQVESAAAPFVWCFGTRARIVLPRVLLDTLDARQLEMIVAHELAHLRRRDHWVRVVELATSILYWWNPMVWWVRRQLHAVEEECCDAWVAWLFPDENHLYAESLFKSAEAVAGPSLALSSPFLIKHRLKARVEMVLKNSSQRAATRMAVACLGLFALATLPIGISVVRGDTQEESEVKQSQSRLPRGLSEAFGPADRKAAEEEPETKIPTPIRDPRLLKLPLREQICEPSPPVWAIPAGGNLTLGNWIAAPVFLDNDRILFGPNILKASSGELLGRFPFGEDQDSIRSIRISSSRKYLLVHHTSIPDPNKWGHLATWFQVWDVQQQKPFGRQITVEAVARVNADLTSDGKTIAISQDESLQGSTVTVWNTVTGEMTKTLPVDLSLFEKGYEGRPPFFRPEFLKFSPDNHWLVTFSPNNAVYWQWQTDEARRVNRLGRRLAAFAFSSDSRNLAEGPGPRDNLHIRDMSSFDIYRTLFDEVNSPMNTDSLAFTPNGKTLIACNSVTVDESKLKIPHRIHFWNIQTGNIMRQLATPGFMPSVLDLSPDGKRLVVGLQAGDTFNVAVWNIDESAAVESGQVKSPNTEQIASTAAPSFDGTWSVSKCESEAATLKMEYPEHRWRWTIKGNGIVWGRQGQQWKLSARVDPSTSPRQIDLTFLEGPHKGESSLGIYDWTGDDGKTLRIRMQDPGAKVGRPSSFAMPKGSQSTLIVLHQIRPIDPVKELASFQGTWCYDIQQLWDWPAPIGIGTDSNGRKSEKRWVVSGNRITWTSQQGERIVASFTIDPSKTPKEIDIKFLTGPFKGQKSLGIYEPQIGNDDYRWLCMTNPGTDAPRPTDVSAGSFKQQTMIGMYPVDAAVNPPIANPLDRFQGTLAMTLCDSLNQKLYAPQEEVSKWRWVVKGNEILWSRQGEEWKLTLKVDGTKKPKEIDLTYLTGPFKGETCLGMYEWGGVDGKSLLIAIQDPGAKAPRPTEIAMSSDSKTSLIFLRPTPDTDVANELASLQGKWTLRNFVTANQPGQSSWPIPGGKRPDHSGDGSELRWTIHEDKIHWTSASGQDIKASFTIDPSKSPKHIDLKFLSGPDRGETCPGIYQRGDLDENILWICIADPGSSGIRPANFSYKWGEGRSMLSLYPFK